MKISSVILFTKAVIFCDKFLYVVPLFLVFVPED